MPAARATADGSPLATLIRLFLLQRPVPVRDALRALPLEAALAAGLLDRDGDGVRALVDVRPYGGDDAPPSGWWVVSDHGTGLDGKVRPLPADHVLGVGGATATLAQVAVRKPASRALDIGTGCGVQALHLSRHSAAVVATDVAPRALVMARLTAALSEVELDLRQGSLLDPVGIGERFDVVVSNPPFVISAGGRHTYRDGGLPGDDLCRRLLADVPPRLAAGGWFTMLGNWVHRRGEDWQERVAGWPPVAGFECLVVQREVLDPAEYAELWLRDSGDVGGRRYPAAYDAELAAFDRAGVEAIGLGFVAVHRSDAAQVASTVDLLDWPHPVEQPLGPHVAALVSRLAWLRRHGSDSTLSGARLRLAADVVQEQVGRPGAEDPEQLLLRQQRGFRRTVLSSTATAALAGACDGTLSVGALAEAVASVLGENPASLRRDLLPEVRSLVRQGFLEPAG